MIPSDHFVRYYNEVFKALEEKGPEHLIAYWRELGRLQCAELAQRFRDGGLKAAFDYWSQIKDEENCVAELELNEDYLDMRMERCPSLSKVLDNDAAACVRYCEHCMGWVEPVASAAGLYAVEDMVSTHEPRCHFRLYRDRAKAEAFRETVQLPSDPYGLGKVADSAVDREPAADSL